MTSHFSLVSSTLRSCRMFGQYSKIRQSSFPQFVRRTLCTATFDSTTIKVSDYEFINRNLSQKMTFTSASNYFVSTSDKNTRQQQQQQHQKIRQFNTSTFIENSSSSSNSNSNSNNTIIESKPLLRLNTIIDPIQIHTKIVCTIGPASDTKEQMQLLMNNGMAVARLNFSHAGDDYTYANHCVQLIRSAPGIHSKIAAVTVVPSSNNNNGSTIGDGCDDTSSTNANAIIPNVRAILVDTKGPEIRTGPLPGNEKVLSIFPGQIVKLFTDRDIVKNSSIPQVQDDIFYLNVDYMNIAQTLQVGNQVLLDDGLIALEVIEIDISTSTVTTKALNGGPIQANKGVNLPGVQLDLPALTDKDKRDLLWACEVGADFVAASFIRTPDNVRSVIAYLDRCVAEIREKQELNNGTSTNGSTAVQSPALIRPLVISKIESQEGVENFDAILEESDGIMVARGDLGVEIMYSRVFAEQKRMVKACNRAGKPVIVATQMLDSMIRNPRPTRAEVTDVGTAVLDGTDAVMLSGETAAGKYPIESIKAMRSVLFEADTILDKIGKNAHVYDVLKQHRWNPKVLNTTSDPLEQELDAVSASACLSARNLGAKCIIVTTKTGRVARAVAGHRPTVPVLAFCTDPQVARRLQLHRAVIPILLQSDKWDPWSKSLRFANLRAEAIRTAKELALVKFGDRVVFVDRTAGKPGDLLEYAHNMKIVTVRQV